MRTLATLSSLFVDATTASKPWIAFPVAIGSHKAYQEAFSRTKLGLDIAEEEQRRAGVEARHDSGRGERELVILSRVYLFRFWQ